MGLYSIMIKPLVRKMEIERASKIALRYFEFVERIPGGRLISRWIHGNRPLGLQREVFGLNFYNPVGLGAGLDIHGVLYNDLNNLGFSFVEAGPLDADGVRRAVNHIQNDPQDDILAACIKDDVQTAFTLAYDFFDFFVIDFSAGVDTDILEPLLNIRLGEETYKPIVVKLPKVISVAEIQEILDFCLMNGLELDIWARDIPSLPLTRASAFTGGKTLLSLHRAPELPVPQSRLQIQIPLPYELSSSGYPSRSMLAVYLDIGLMQTRAWMPLWPDIAGQ